MNTEQKLTKIREKCVGLLEDSKKYGKVSLGNETGEAEAGWKATICAIDYLMNYASDQLEEEEAREEIIAAWEGLV